MKRAQLHHFLCSLDFPWYFERATSCIAAKSERALKKTSQILQHRNLATLQNKAENEKAGKHFRILSHTLWSCGIPELPKRGNKYLQTVDANHENSTGWTDQSGLRQEETHLCNLLIFHISSKLFSNDYAIFIVTDDIWKCWQIKTCRLRFFLEKIIKRAFWGRTCLNWTHCTSSEGCWNKGSFSDFA